MSDELKYKGFYEILYVAHPNVDEAGQKEIQEKMLRVIAEGGGQVLREEVWGRRRFAYEIRKVLEGFYVWIHFRDLKGQVARALENMIRTEGRIIRHLVIAQTKAKLLQDEQQAARDQAAAEAAAAAAAAEAAAAEAATAEAAAAEAAAAEAASQPEPEPEPAAGVEIPDEPAAPLAEAPVSAPVADEIPPEPAVEEVPAETVAVASETAEESEPSEPPDDVRDPQ